MNSFYFSLFTAGLSFSTLVSGAPTARANDSPFSIAQVKNTKFTRSGPLALAKVYTKYGVEMPEDLAASVKRIKSKSAKKRRDSGSATTSPTESDSEWLTPVKIGTPAQTFNLDFDTGSSDLWVFSTETTGVSGHTEYNPSNSSTSTKLTGSTWSIEYGDGSSSSGDVYTDKVTIGGLTVTAQAVEAAETVSDSFTTETDLDGLLGLAFSSINTVTPTKQKTFFDNALSQLSSKVFTADLKHDAPGTYNFGFINASAHTGTITYTAVDSSDGFWGFTSSGYGVGNGTFSETSISAIADTGTTLLMLPDEINVAYYSQVSGASYDSSVGGYVFDCDADLPAFTFGIGDAQFTIPSEYMNYASISGTSEDVAVNAYGGGPGQNGGGDYGNDFGGENADSSYGPNSGNSGSFGQTTNLCYGGLQSSDDIGINIFGDIALKAAFVVFDGGNTQLGWASKSLS